MTAVIASMAAGFTPAAAQDVAEANPLLTGDLTRGERLYRQRCAACHALDANRAGPSHRGVVGREAGTVSGYRYTAALRDSGLIWTPEALDEWLANPPAMVPGTSMGVRIPNAQARADIITWLAEQTDPPSETD
ncbi:c-type cytochrome [Hyphobacterium marinum]|uniref:C-type cytochrome n=1 Tax=Hyphobacterium marinum TaxID=3116574 RepID=A0ABU7M0X9_9PROT|nr:c-type cytochrome [Hyphobacterium sp. Y6023]MEE2567472.1 c-type cytochrome [Hyphobacterium sp. Y6023]